MKGGQLEAATNFARNSLGELSSRPRRRRLTPYQKTLDMESKSDLYWFSVQEKITRLYNPPEDMHRRRLSGAEQKRQFKVAIQENDKQASLGAKLALLDEAWNYLYDGEIPPAIIRDFAIYVLLTYREKISRKRGQNPFTHDTRNLLIRKTIHGLKRFGYRPTRNAAQKKQECGCSIVVKALADGGLYMTEDSVKKIWDYRQKNLFRD
jgi:hypothetical protein